MENTDKVKNNENKKRLIRAAVSLTMVFVLSMTVFAWFTNEKKLDTITKVTAPTTLVIGAGNKEAAANIDLGEIDVTKVDESTKQGKSDYVFCVYSDSVLGSYKLQLAHTTNIPFTYTIYKATEDTNTGDVIYHSADENIDYCYKKSTELAGAYKNLVEETNIADNTFHNKTYENYDKVQKNAEPLYWQTKESISPTQSQSAGGKGFVDYYILELTWDNTLKNEKETDMVYITASMTSTEATEKM